MEAANAFQKTTASIEDYTARYQTDALKFYSKEATQAFLNENYKGLEDATEQIAQERHYILRNDSISDYTDDGKALKEIAEQFEEQGISIRSDSKGAALFSIHLTTDAENVYDTINALCTAVKEKSKELSDSEYFDDVLEMSSEELNNAKKSLTTGV